MSDIYLYRDLYVKTGISPLTGSQVALLPELLRLADLRVKGADAATFIEEVLNVLRMHPTLAAIDRLCLTQLAPGTSMLTVLGSANSLRVKNNAVTTGYHCFITDGGSLTRVREGRLRLFGDANEVVDSFRTAGSPPQRTIRLVAEMGLHSGLCLPIEQLTCTGFLFINSIERHLFATPSIDVIATLGLVAQFARPFIKFSPPDHPPLRWPAVPLNWDRFFTSLTGAASQRFGNRLGFYAEALPPGQNMPFLWCPDAAIHGILEASLLLIGGQQRPHRILVSLHPRCDQSILLRLRDAASPAMVTAPDLNALRFYLSPWEIDLTPLASGGIEMRVPIDTAFYDHHGTYYSI